MFAACDEDVGQFCHHIPSHKRKKVKKCLWRHRREVSSKCHRMVAKVHRWHKMHKLKHWRGMKHRIHHMIHNLLHGRDCGRDCDDAPRSRTRAEMPEERLVRRESGSNSVGSPSAHVNWRAVENIAFGVCGALAGIAGAVVFISRRRAPSAPAYSRVASRDEELQELQVVQCIVVDESAAAT